MLHQITVKRHLKHRAITQNIISYSAFGDTRFTDTAQRHYRRIIIDDTHRYRAANRSARQTVIRSINRRSAMRNHRFNKRESRTINVVVYTCDCERLRAIPILRGERQR